MGPQDDRWMERWLPALREAAPGLLELGCDRGGDTQWLVQQGFDVVAADISAQALQECARRVPAAHLVQLDLRHPLPFDSASFGVIVASLCLHYFDEPSTARALAEVHRCLLPGGLLLCRLNSTRDVLHGAGQGDEVEPHYYRVHGTYSEYKRFFDLADIERWFDARWQRLCVEERTVHRYTQPKIAWELALLKR